MLQLDLEVHTDGSFKRLIHTATTLVSGSARGLPNTRISVCVKAAVELSEQAESVCPPKIKSCSEPELRQTPDTTWHDLQELEVLYLMN